MGSKLGVAFRWDWMHRLDANYLRSLIREILGLGGGVSADDVG